MTLLLLLLASVAYVCGGIAMKCSDGLRHLGPSLAIFFAFCCGAALQALGMRDQTLGIGYVLVLGMEAVLAVVAGILFFSESFPVRQVLGMIVVLIGMFMLKSTP